MIILAVDTTTLSGSVALLENKKLLAEVNIDSPSTYSERLLPSVDFVLKSHGLNIKNIDGFALAAGPGSFTGIRIGLSSIKSFAYASRKPVAAVSTLEAMAWKLRHPQNRLLCPLLDAKKGEIFASLFKSKGNSFHEIIPQGAYLPDRFFSMLPAHRIILFFGNGVDTYRERIFRYCRDQARFSYRSFFIAFEVGLLGYEILKKKKGLNFQDIKPFYFRKSQAEEED